MNLEFKNRKEEVGRIHYNNIIAGSIIKSKHNTWIFLGRTFDGRYNFLCLETKYTIKEDRTMSFPKDWIIYEPV